MAIDPGPPHWHEGDQVPHLHEGSHSRMGPHKDWDARKSMRMGAWQNPGDRSTPLESVVREARAIADAIGVGHTVDTLRALADRVEELEEVPAALIEWYDDHRSSDYLLELVVNSARQALSTQPHQES